VFGVGSKFQISRLLESKYTKLVCIAGLVVILDQVTKAVVLSNIALYDSIRVVPGFFNITHIHNPGGAFGFMAGQSEFVRQIIFLFAASLAMGLILYFYKKTPPTHPWLLTGFAMILGGAIGNIIDRIRMGKVVDFLDFFVGTLHWPSFNIADSAISVGIGIFVTHLVFNKLPE
jgi:signal peptidase II